MPTDKTPAVSPLEDLLGQVAQLDSLPDEDLGALRELLAAQAEEMLADPTDEVLAAVESILTAMNTVTTAQNDRAEAAEARSTRAAELLAAVRGSDPDPEEKPAEPEPDEDDKPADPPAPAPNVEVEINAEVVELETPAAETEPAVEKIAASADKPSIVTRVELRRPARPKPTVRAAEQQMVIRASANVPGTQPGEILDTSSKLANAFQRAQDASRGWSGEGRFNVPVATLGTYDAKDMYGEARYLGQDPQSNQSKIDAVVSRPALRASGGICAPAAINYDQPVTGTDMRPVRDSMLASFGASRGGVTTFAPPQLFDTAVTNGTTTWTEANDESPASPATKNVTTMTCPSPHTTLVNAQVQIAKIGNMRQMFWREQVDAFMAKLGQATARTAETNLLTTIGAGSTQVSHQTVLGTARDVLAHIDLTASQMRSRYRLAPDAPLRLGFPDWLYDNIRVDLTREQPGASVDRLGTTEAQIDQWFAARQINTTAFLDGESGQIFGAQTDGAAVGWPTHVIGYIYPEGEWLYLDGGELNLGLVRDSTLNGTNDFEMFSEFFENAHRIFAGPSYRLDIDICPSGATSLPIALGSAPSTSICASGS